MFERKPQFHNVVNHSTALYKNNQNSGSDASKSSNSNSATSEQLQNPGRTLSVSSASTKSTESPTKAASEDASLDENKPPTATEELVQIPGPKPFSITPTINKFSNENDNDTEKGDKISNFETAQVRTNEEKPTFIQQTDLSTKTVACERIQSYVQTNTQNADRCLSIVSKASQRQSMAIRSTRAKSKIFQKVEEIAEADEFHGQLSNKSIYGGAKNKVSRYSTVNHDPKDDDDARSQKITKEARNDINKMHEIMKQIFEKVMEAQELILKRDFEVCRVIIGLMSNFESVFEQMINHLRYSPYKMELSYIKIALQHMIDELEIEPPFVLLRLVEFGYHIYEIGTRLREDILPSSFVLMIHSIQTRLYRLQTGRVVRQIYFVPMQFDPVISTYFKSRKIIRVESFCHCKIVLLDPDDPRCGYCPDNYRTIEVNFDFEKGRYLGFANLLNACAPAKIFTVKLVATIFRRLCGVEVDLAPEEVVLLESTEPRLGYRELTKDLKTGTGTAVTPKVNHY